MNHPSKTLKRGIIAGIIGGLALAVWFLVVDVVQHQPFRTPAFLASAVLGHEQVQFAAFILVGLAVTWLLERTETPPHFLLGVVLGFLLFDLVFYLGVIATGVNVVRALGWPEV